MTTEDDLRGLAGRLYWLVENGDMDEALAKLKSLQKEGLAKAAELCDRYETPTAIKLAIAIEHEKL